MDIMDDSSEDLIPINPVHSSEASAKQIVVDMLRLDMTDTVISGNKWFKLLLNLQTARINGHQSLLSFGGSWSNHLVATAAAARHVQLSSIGIVRGLHAADAYTPALQRCTAHGMQLYFCSRAEYARKDDPAFLDELRDKWSNPYIIPEGGANHEGRTGAGLIATFIPREYTHICVSVGSGTTLAGLREVLPIDQHILGFVPMKQGRYLKPIIEAWLSDEQNQNWSLTDAYHFGGFGKMPVSLRGWMQTFLSEQHIPLDRVYTAKMMYGVMDMINQNAFPQHARILCIHTGGLQGNA